MIDSYSLLQISASESVSMRPQKRFVEPLPNSEKSPILAIDDVTRREISKQIRIRTIIDLNSEAIWKGNPKKKEEKCINKEK